MKNKMLSFIVSLGGILIVVSFAFLASQLLPVFALDQTSSSAKSDAIMQQQQRIPTPVGAVTKVPYAQPMPTRADGKPNTVATLIPATRVRLGSISEIQEQETPLALFASLGSAKSSKGNYPIVFWDSTRRYTIRNGADDYNSFRKLFVRDAQTGQEVRLGNDGGDAYAPAGTDQYIVWFFRCYEECDKSPIQSGLYVYEFKTGSNILVGNTSDHMDLKADGRWIAYAKVTSLPKQGLVNCYGDLYVYNLDTKKEQYVDSHVPWRCAADSGFYALSNNRLIWTQFDGSLGLLDLKTGQSRKLKIAGGGRSSHLSFSGDYIVWGIFGYDLRQDALFNLSLSVPGWENLQVNGSISPVVKDDRVYWGEGVTGQIHYFSAPLMRVASPYSGP